jgi:DNA replication protein DnaC
MLENMSAQLKSLRMSGLLGTLDVRNKQAIEQQLSHVEFLALILQDEYERRETKKLSQRLRRANFQGERTLDNFKFDTPHLKVNRSLIYDLATCKFIEEKVNVLMVGPTGVGKSHLAQAIGHTACRKGYDVLYVHMEKMQRHLRAAKADGTYDRKLQNLARPDLIILDDLGLKPFRPPADEEFHELICERYERGSILVTSNLDFDEWGSIFPNPVLASATVDRLRDNAYRVIIEGESYRKPKPLKQEAA